jgi:hypothetical protein
LCRRWGIASQRSPSDITNGSRYTSKPLHFFGRIGSALFLAGFAVLAYLTFLWTRSIPIGTRPLLSFGVLLVLVGGQIVFTGLLADLIVNINQNRKQEFPLKYASDAEQASPSAPVAQDFSASPR